MNRQQRRKENRNAARKESQTYMNPDYVRNVIYKNGLTPKDMDDAYDNGFKAASVATIKMVYAAIIVGLHDQYGFGKIRCMRALKAIDYIVCNELSTSEAIDRAFDEVGIKINVRDPIDKFGDNE